eukprot:901829-Pelagomonas_calceolata.AAC.2
MAWQLTLDASDLAFCLVRPKLIMRVGLDRYRLLLDHLCVDLSEFLATCCLPEGRHSITLDWMVPGVLRKRYFLVGAGLGVIIAEVRYLRRFQVHSRG